ncbi:uncharacterized protein DEA37_0006387 [Paragonimus westermani]|uniref:Uncharacterized protein n=1 Tax=Paragonimus westermani TaxID=34504 RepID=A0A5J4NB09_9TREM|nr:uncharacterized protein DEA37_0006387 [Paragonimus westermani]
MHSLLSGNLSSFRLHAPQPFESHDPKRQAKLTDSCPTSFRLLQMSHPDCLRSRLKELSDALCLLDATFSLILASGPSSSPRSMPLVNRRHRLVLELGALYGAGFIRNYWCQRRHVSFTACWSYTSDIETPHGRHRAQSFRRSDYFSEKYAKWGDTVGYCSDQPDNGRHQFRRQKSCRSPQSGGPDWFVVTSLTTQLLLLTDPYDVPAIWYADTQTESDSFGNSAHMFWTSGHSTPDQTAGKQTDSVDTGEVWPLYEPENDWYGASIREQRHFVQHGQYVVENMAYAHNALQLLCSFVEFRALLSPKTSGSEFSSELFSDSGPHMEDWSSHSSIHFDTSDFTSSGTPNVTTSNKLLQSMTRVWLMADQFGLLDHHNRVTLKVHVPGRVDLAHLASSDSSRKRYLASILLFEKDRDRNYALSLLLLSNRQHRQDLGAEMDAAFSDYLTEGEKALATILANTNLHQGPRRMTSPLKDTYLSNAMSSAFHWLYYWSVLKPLASAYSFHVGFSMLLGMLRALGVEPKSSLFDTERNLELEALFVGSPEAFASVCFSVLHIGWLSQTSVSLTWLITPDEWMRTPKDFIELLNLHSITDCDPG